MRPKVDKNKILVISAPYPPMRVGEADHAFHLCRHLAASGLEVHVLTAQGRLRPETPGVTVHPLMRDWSWSDLPRYGRFLKRVHPDAIILMYIGFFYNDHPMMTFGPTISKTILPSVPFVTQFENAFGALPHKTSVLARVLRKMLALYLGVPKVDYSFGTLLRDSHRIIVLSDHHRVQLESLNPSVDKKCVLIPPPPILQIVPENAGSVREKVRQGLGLESKDILLVYLGRIYPGKGIEHLLRAVQLVVSRKRVVRLVIVGGVIDKEFPERPSYAREILELPESLGIANRVTWVGEYTWDSEKPSTYLHAADICALPFDRGVQLNNSSFSAAAAHGLPIITTRRAALEQQFLHEENVFLCPPRDPEALAKAIETLMDQPDLRKRLSCGVRKLAHEWFSWDRAVERTIETLS